MMVKILMAPLRAIVRFPLFQLFFVIAIILWLQAADESSTRGQMFSWLDQLAETTVRLSSTLIPVRSFTRAWLISGSMIAYVYLACLVILLVLRLILRLVIDILGKWNVFWLRTAIARERGIRAYRAWLPLERIRPAHVSQQAWEERFAWPANNAAPYPPLVLRFLLGIALYAGMAVLAVLLLEYFAPALLAWLTTAARKLFN